MSKVKLEGAVWLAASITGIEEHEAANTGIFNRLVLLQLHCQPAERGCYCSVVKRRRWSVDDDPFPVTHSTGINIVRISKMG